MTTQAVLHDKKRLCCLYKLQLSDGEECVLAGVLSDVEELLLDAQKLIVLADAVGAGGCAGLDLSTSCSDRKICDERILCFPATVGNDRTVAAAVR